MAERTQGEQRILQGCTARSGAPPVCVPVHPPLLQPARRKLGSKQLRTPGMHETQDTGAAKPGNEWGRRHGGLKLPQLLSPMRVDLLPLHTKRVHCGAQGILGLERCFSHGRIVAIARARRWW